MSRLNPGRLAAGRALLAVERGAHAEDMLAELAPLGPDRALAWHLTLGVLRRQGALDATLQPFLKRPIADLDPVPRMALRVGLFEAAETSRTAVHAAVDQAVELTRRLKAPYTTGLVNAVLRKAIGAGLKDDPFLDIVPWLQERWQEPLWAGWVARLREPAVISVATVDGQPPVGLETRPASAAGQVVPGVFQVVSGGLVASWAGFGEGHWWVMDPAAAAVADLAQGRAGLRVLDACAAPGGKTFRLAAAGADVVAVDLSPERLLRLSDGVSRLGLSSRVQVQQHDWLSGPLADAGQFDVVVVDAPCTGLGVIRRHPEVRWRRLPSDPAAMALRQRPILRSAAAHVRPGGRLVYAVCSPMPEEGLAVVSSLSGWRVAGAWSSSPPQRDEDAFQAFVLARVAEDEGED